MYVPAHFDEVRSEALHGLIAEYPLGALVVHRPTGLDANHLPSPSARSPLADARQTPAPGDTWPRGDPPGTKLYEKVRLSLKWVHWNDSRRA
jgi:hypothetical protein